ncbi:MAG: hypothetical protein II135_03500 [Clostridia bacterium]|nr:hypothetical protein [Clostridia bacterium]
MKKRIYAAIAAALAVFTLFSCGEKTPAETVTEAVTAKVTETDSQVTETVPPEPETAKRLDIGCKTEYKENVTEANGTATYGGIRKIVEFKSAFYGHQSAINRDFLYYGRNFNFAKASDLPALDGRISGADIDGDGFAELFHYKNGKLSVWSISMIYKKNKIVIPTERMTFSASLLKEFEIGKGLDLCGAGDMNGDGYNDILFYSPSYAVVYFGEAEGFEAAAYRFDAAGKVLCGDVDGDRIFELIDADKNVIKSYKIDNNEITAFTHGTVNAELPDKYAVYAADVNADGLCDIVYSENKDPKLILRSFFGRGDGRFGCYEEDNGNKNLYAVFECNRTSDNIGFADFTGNGAYDIAGTFSKSSVSSTGILFSYDEPAYDYSLFGMRVNGEYRIYSGCRWSDANFDQSDGDHVMLTVSKDGVNWRRYIDAPMFYLGWELGVDEWWSDNTLEPEVLYVDGKYHMYWQCSYVTPKGNYGDKIGYAYSDDGIHWTRKTDEPAVICDDPEIGFNHEEMLYVPDDPDGKPFWMYTGHFVNGQFRGYVRIRSSQPDRFLYSDRESTEGFAQIGNQIAYATDESGNRTFIRITFCDADDGYGNTVWRPTLYLSKDGLRFYGSKSCVLAGVDTSDPRTVDNHKTFFLGMITENGTGELPRNEDGSYRIIYLATTCASSVAPEIFNAEAGFGIADIFIK